MKGDTYRSCWLCGRNGSGDPLDGHHIFGGPYRKASERYGLTVYLCHDRCHENGPEAAHRCRATRELLCAWGQEKVMREQGWTEEQFRAVFGRSWGNGAGVSGRRFSGHLAEVSERTVPADTHDPSVTGAGAGDSSLYRKGAIKGAVRFRVLDAELPF